MTINPAEAYQSLVDYRQEQARVVTPALRIVGETRRCAITDAKQPMLDAILAILEERRQFWPLSDRPIHYALLNDPPPGRRARHGA